MAKFNAKKKGTKTTNRAGGKAYKQSNELALVSLLLTSFVKDQYYRSANQALDELHDLVQDVDPKFAAQAAIFARREFGMRSITHALAGSIASRISGKPYARSFYDKVVFRVDDMSEILSYFHSINDKGGKITSAMKNGFSSAIQRFDEYQLAKYRGEGKEVSLIDVVRLIHPPKTSPNIESIGKLVRGELKSTETWESKISATGQSKDSQSKTEAWSELVTNKKLGYLALLRNLRNIANNAPEVLDEALTQLTNKNFIKKSLVMPFRFINATAQFEGSTKVDRKIQNALMDAFEISLDNIPDLPNTLVVVDNSGSMSSSWGSQGKHFGVLNHAQMGAMFGMMLAKKSNADIMEFGSHARMIGYNSRTDVFKFAMEFPNKNKVGHGTDFSSIFELIKNKGKKYDRIVIFSDMQGWRGSVGMNGFLEYKKSTGAEPFIYSFDLTGYGDMQFPEDKVFALAGFSNKVFDMMSALEQDRHTMLNTIKEVQI